jgi:hypothetical protein
MAIFLFSNIISQQAIVEMQQKVSKKFTSNLEVDFLEKRSEFI